MAELFTFTEVSISAQLSCRELVVVASRLRPPHRTAPLFVATVWEPMVLRRWLARALEFCAWGDQPPSWALANLRCDVELPAFHALVGEWALDRRPRSPHPDVIDLVDCHHPIRELGWTGLRTGSFALEVRRSAASAETEVATLVVARSELGQRRSSINHA